MPRKNVLVIWADSVSWQLFSKQLARGNLPTLQRLVQRGVLFTQCVASATTTGPCTASLLTGRYLFNHGLQAQSGYRVRNGVSTIAEVFLHHGYRTTAFMSGPLSPVLGLDRGFDDYYWRNAEENLRGGLKSQVLENMHRSDDQRPWFILLHLWETHAPYWLSSTSIKHNWYYRFRLRRRYEQSLIDLDHELGDIVDSLDFESTIVAFLGDHGELVGTLAQRLLHRVQQWRGKSPLDRDYIHLGHGSHLHEELIRVPFILCADAIVEHHAQSTLVRHVDVAPSLASLAGLTWSGEIDGSRLFNDAGEFQAPPQLAFVEAVGRVHVSPKYWLIGCRTPEWKYITAPLSSERPDELFRIISEDARGLDAASAPSVIAMLREAMEQVRGVSLSNLEWPVPNLQDDEKDILEERLSSLGYL